MPGPTEAPALLWTRPAVVGGWGWEGHRTNTGPQRRPGLHVPAARLWRRPMPTTRGRLWGPPGTLRPPERNRPRRPWDWAPSQVSFSALLLTGCPPPPLPGQFLSPLLFSPRLNTPSEGLTPFLHCYLQTHPPLLEPSAPPH